MTRRISVGVAVPYDVVIGSHIAAVEVVAALSDATTVAVLCSARLPVVDIIVDALEASGKRVHVVDVPDSEAGKSAAVVATLWKRLGAIGLTRSDAVVGVGGGALTDVAGFAAATWLRGVRFVTVPTTVLGMVDAAVGGKTGINTAAGKNLVGAFHQPSAVIVDRATLGTLPVETVRAGLAEVAKIGFTSDPGVLDLLMRSDATDPSGEVLGELIERAIAVKAAVVAADTFEHEAVGLGRLVLNYGHTFGHAVEAVQSYGWPHGHAVSVGLVYAAELSHLAGRLDSASVARHREVLTQLELPTFYDAGQWPALRATMQLDKKSRGDRLRFVVLDQIGSPGMLDCPAEDLLEAAYGAVSS